jgi:23S rRNA (uracil1939-C5)-methyltransferase
MKQNAVVRVKVHGLGYGGQGVARIDGFVLFVPRALPGDMLEVRVKSLKKRYGSAEIIKVLEPSTDRRDPGCKAFDAGCGGCQWLHLDYAEQRRQKMSIVRESFKRIGKINVRVNDIVGAEHQYGCRNKFSLSRDVAGTLGLCVEKSVTVLDLADCRMETASNLKAYNMLKTLPLPDSVTQAHCRTGTGGEVSLCLYAESVDESLLRDLIQPMIKAKIIAGAALKMPGRFSHLGGEESVTAEVGGFGYSIPIDVFFQTNYEQAGKLLALVRREIDLSPGDRVLDLYSGLGFFTLDCARAGCPAVGVESHMAAVREAERAARTGDLDASFVHTDVGKYLRRYRDGKGRFSKIILDPPRAGCGEETVRRLAGLGSEQIVYVSCAPDTLARDCGIFSECGYKVTGCTPVDMFPQTYHVETVTTLVNDKT